LYIKVVDLKNVKPSAVLITGLASKTGIIRRYTNRSMYRIKEKRFEETFLISLLDFPGQSGSFWIRFCGTKKCRKPMNYLKVSFPAVSVKAEGSKTPVKVEYLKGTKRIVGQSLSTLQDENTSIEYKQSYKIDVKGTDYLRTLYTAVDADNVLLNCVDQYNPNELFVKREDPSKHFMVLVKNDEFQDHPITVYCVRKGPAVLSTIYQFLGGASLMTRFEINCSEKEELSVTETSLKGYEGFGSLIIGEESLMYPLGLNSTEVASLDLTDFAVSTEEDSLKVQLVAPEPSENRYLITNRDSSYLLFTCLKGNISGLKVKFGIKFKMLGKEIKINGAKLCGNKKVEDSNLKSWVAVWSLRLTEIGLLLLIIWVIKCLFSNMKSLVPAKLAGSGDRQRPRGSVEIMHI
jgi:hypothetical protein